jgi:transcriptional regulator with XRE-family HTH domain
MIEKTTSQNARSATDVDLHVGLRLKGLREAAGWTQQQLAKDAGISFQQLQKYERGQNRVSAGRLFSLAKLMDVSPCFFFEGMEGMPENGQSEGSGNSNLLNLANQPETLAALRAFSAIKSDATRKKAIELIRLLAAE